MDIYIIVDGVAHSLTDASTCILASQDGVGMAPLHRISQRGPQQHGDSDVGYRLDPRIVQLALEIHGSTQADQYAKRSRLLSWFRPRGRTLALRWVLPDGSLRQLDCHYVSDMSLATQAGGGFRQRVGLTLRAPDPTFYDPVAVALTFSVYASAGGEFAVPTSVPTAVGGTIINQDMALTYAGSVVAYPHLIRITGPLNNPALENKSTGEKLDFTGTEIAAGDHYDIDLRYGYKTIFDALGVNRIAALTTDSDLATWHLAPAGEVVDGINALRIAATLAGAGAKVELTYYNRYIGF